MSIYIYTYLYIKFGKQTQGSCDGEWNCRSGLIVVFWKLDRGKWTVMDDKNDRMDEQRDLWYSATVESYGQKCVSGLDRFYEFRVHWIRNYIFVLKRLVVYTPSGTHCECTISKDSLLFASFIESLNVVGNVVGREDIIAAGTLKWSKDDEYRRFRQYQSRSDNDFKFKSRSCR